MVGAFFEAAIQVGARKPGSDAEDIVLVACSVFARETALHSAERLRRDGVTLRARRSRPRRWLSRTVVEMPTGLAAAPIRR